MNRIGPVWCAGSGPVCRVQSGLPGLVRCAGSGLVCKVWSGVVGLVRCAKSSSVCQVRSGVPGLVQCARSGPRGVLDPVWCAGSGCAGSGPVSASGPVWQLWSSVPGPVRLLVPALGRHCRTVPNHRFAAIYVTTNTDYHNNLAPSLRSSSYPHHGKLASKASIMELIWFAIYSRHNIANLEIKKNEIRS